jgi:hypothetical protein
MIRAAVLQNAEYVRKNKNLKKQKNIRLLTEEEEKKRDLNKGDTKCKKDINRREAKSYE